MSSGKDTSRMIKMVRENDAEAAKKLEEWKDVVKQGKDTEDTKREMREVAARAVEEWKAASVDAALGEETSSEQVKEEQTTT